jgi:hypothetical protein
MAIPERSGTARLLRTERRDGERGGAILSCRKNGLVMGSATER